MTEEKQELNYDEKFVSNRATPSGSNFLKTRWNIFLRRLINAFIYGPISFHSILTKFNHS